MIIRKLLSVVSVLALSGCITTQPQSNQTNPQTTSHQRPLTTEHNKLFDAIDYINKEIQNSPANKFVNKEGKTLSAEQRRDFIETINNEKNRINKYPSGVYNEITGSLQTGVVYPACRKRGGLNLDCGDFDRSFSLTPQLGMSFELAIIADEKGYTHIPLARHYRYGLAVQKDIKSAYELYRKEQKLRDAEFQQDEIVRMLQEELMAYDSKVSDSGNLDSVTCDSYKNLTGESNCSKATLAEMFDALSVERIARESVPPTLAALNGRWVSDKPIVLGGTKINGFDIGREGIMYDSVVNGVRNFPSSFNYNLSGEALKFEITFSAAGLPRNAIYIFDARMTKNGAIVLKYEGQTAVYKKFK